MGRKRKWNEVGPASDGSQSPSGVSLKSLHVPPNLKAERPDRSQSHSGVSLKSLHVPPNLGAEGPDGSQTTTDQSPGPSGVSLKSDRSKHIPPNLGAESPEHQLTREPPSPPHRTRGQKRHKLSVSHTDETGDNHDWVLNDLKEQMRQKYTYTTEGDGDRQASLESIYTELYITPGESGGPQAEHELSQLDRKLKMPTAPKYTVSLKDIFRPLSGQEALQRVVLTKGSAGIGKSFSVQKFIHDWAKGDTNKDIHFVFSLAFRELNLITQEKSLHKLLTEFHPALQTLKSPDVYANAKVVVILDSLDETRFQLDFQNAERKTSLTEETPVADLLVNLIQGHLLPKAKVWITSRPQAALLIPAENVDMVTEIRGFTKEQKDEYFRRRFSQDPGLAERIISHLHSSQQLLVMCQIPIFCWIAAILFMEVFADKRTIEIPQTLTEMMAHYLFAQTKRRNRKYDKKPEEHFLKTQKEFLLKLSKLAFDHLKKDSLIFYEEDLEKYGIDMKEASIQSGFCTTVLREEDVFSNKKVFFFVHLTIQEFFAALYVHDCFMNKKTTELQDFLKLEDKEHTLLELLKLTVEVVLEKDNGHLTYFLRFLLGLMVEANGRVLQGLLTFPDPSQEIDKKILTYLKSIRRKTVSPEGSLVLFRVMVEMRDQKVKAEVEEYLKTEDGSKPELTALHCSGLSYILQVSKDDLDVLDLKSYNTSDEGRRRLISAVKSSKKAILASCRVSTESVKHVAFGLTFPWSPLRDLDLSNNDLTDSGVELLCEGLKSQNCKLKQLRLSGCLVTEGGCGFLISALRSNPSHLKKLDLSYNNPGESGISRLKELTQDSEYKLNQVIVDHCGSERMKPGFMKYACKLTFDPKTAHQNLHLSQENRKVTWMLEKKSYPNHPERFDQCPQVLCKESVDGCCYWEAEVTEPFNIGVRYKATCRSGDGDGCKLGCNDESWSLVCSDQGCYALHGNQRVNVSSLCQRSSRVGVYLDREGGSLSFYRVSSNNWVHLHSFRAVFREPLYPAVELRSPSSVLLC